MKTFPNIQVGLNLPLKKKKPENWKQVSSTTTRHSISYGFSILKKDISSAVFGKF